MGRREGLSEMFFIFENRLATQVAVVSAAIFLSASAALSQQYRNLEVTPDGRGGASGTYGNQNFDVSPDYSRPNNRRSMAPVIAVPPNNATGGKTRKSCYVDGNGTAICR